MLLAIAGGPVIRHIAFVTVFAQGIIMLVCPMVDAAIDITDPVDVSDMVAGGHHGAAKDGAGFFRAGEEGPLHQPYRLGKILHAILERRKIDDDRADDLVLHVLDMVREVDTDDGRFDVVIIRVVKGEQMDGLHILDGYLMDVVFDDHLRFMHKIIPAADRSMLMLDLLFRQGEFLDLVLE